MWDKPTGDISGYKIYRSWASPYPALCWDLIGSCDTYARTFTPLSSLNLLGGLGEFQFSVSAYNRFNVEGPRSNTVSVKVDNAPPSAPSVSATCDASGKILATWTASTDVGCAGLDSQPYKVELATSQDTNFDGSFRNLNLVSATDWNTNWTSLTSQNSSTNTSVFSSGKTFYIHAQAKDKNLVKSSWGQTLAVTCPDLDGPSCSNISYSVNSVVNNPPGPYADNTTLNVKWDVSDNASLKYTKLLTDADNNGLPETTIGTCDFSTVFPYLKTSSCNINWTTASHLSKSFAYKTIIEVGDFSQKVSYCGGYPVCFDSLAPSVTSASLSCKRVGTTSTFVPVFTYSGSDSGCSGLNQTAYSTTLTTGSYTGTSVSGWNTGWVSDVLQESPTALADGTTVTLRLKLKTL